MTDEPESKPEVPPEDVLPDGFVGRSPVNGQPLPENKEGWQRARDAKARKEEERAKPKRAIEAAMTKDDPNAVVRILFEEAAKAALGLYQKYNRGRTGEGPSKALLDASREVRALAETLREILEREGAQKAIENILEDLETRIAQALERDVPPEPVPLAAVGN